MRDIVAGFGNGIYGPDGPVSREQMSAFLKNTYGLELP
jgi:hypothetical protein